MYSDFSDGDEDGGVIGFTISTDDDGVVRREAMDYGDHYERCWCECTELCGVGLWDEAEAKLVEMGQHFRPGTHGQSAMDKLYAEVKVGKAQASIVKGGGAAGGGAATTMTRAEFEEAKSALVRSLFNGDFLEQVVQLDELCVGYCQALGTVKSDDDATGVDQRGYLRYDWDETGNDTRDNGFPASLASAPLAALVESFEIALTPIEVFDDSMITNEQVEVVDFLRGLGEELLRRGEFVAAAAVGKQGGSLNEHAFQADGGHTAMILLAAEASEAAGDLKAAREWYGRCEGTEDGPDWYSDDGGANIFGLPVAVVKGGSLDERIARCTNKEGGGRAKKGGNEGTEGKESDCS